MRSSASPSDAPYPGCWGNFRGDDACDSCPRCTSCEKVTARLRQRVTVHEALAASAVPADFAQEEPDDLADYAQSLAVGAGHRKPFRSWRCDRKWIQALESVIAACTSAGWAPRTFVRANIESLTPLIARGIPLRPGSFTTPAASARFSRWLSRSKGMHGDVSVDRNRADVVAVNKREGAARVFGSAYLRGGASVSTAEYLAQAVDPRWTYDTSSLRDRLLALDAALGEIHPTLPRRVTVPPGEWTWDDALAAVTALAEAPAAKAVSKSWDASLGEVFGG